MRAEDLRLEEIDRPQIFALFSHDFLLMVLGIKPGGDLLTMGDEEQAQWCGRYKIWDQLSGIALPQSEALPFVDADPSILDFEHYFKKPFLLDREFNFYDEINIMDFIIRV